MDQCSKGCISLMYYDTDPSALDLEHAYLGCHDLGLWEPADTMSTELSIMPQVRWSNSMHAVLHMMEIEVERACQGMNLE